MSLGWVRTVTSKGQFSIPLELCRRLGLQKGDKLIVEVIDDRSISFRKAPTTVEAAFRFLSRKEAR